MRFFECDNPPRAFCEEAENVSEEQVRIAAADRGLTLLRRLGSGSSARVYLVENEKGQSLALKVSGNHKLLENEAKHMRQLDAPLFPDYYDYWETSEAAYLLMEYIEGAVPFPLHNCGRFEAAVAAARLGVQIAEGLLPLQEISPQLVVRDIKPENMLLTGDGKLRLLDMGLICRTGINRGVAGTDCFAAPEQFTVGSLLETATDLYGLGKSMEQIYRGMLAGESRLPTKFAKLIRWFTEQDSERRIPNARFAVCVLTRYAKEGEAIRFSKLEKECMSGKIRFVKAIGIF